MRNFRSLLMTMLFLALILFSASGSAQVTTGSILGTVHDQTGAVVSGASVKITDAGKGTTSVKQTDADGSYVVPFLIPGSYNVSVEMNGFKRSVSNNIVLDIDQRARVDFALEIGAIAETVEVTSAPPLIRLDSSELGQVIGKTQVQNLPLNGRDFASLVYLAPGITPGQAGENLSGSSSFNPRAATNFNALGSQANTNSFLVDGIVDDEYTFGSVMVQPSVQSIAEFKVLTGSYSAEFGQGAGVVSVSTRSGSNGLHGEVFVYIRNSAVDARNYFARVGSAVQKPAYRRGQFGAAVAGSIIKDKLFYFADYYGQRSLRGIVNQNSVPTAAQRIGDFSNYTDLSGNLIKIYDPLTTTVNASGQSVRTQFKGCDGQHPNVICPNRLNQVGVNVASIYPLPQTGGSFNNFVSTANQVIDDNGGNTRIDYHQSTKDSAFVRFSYERFLQNAPNPLVNGQGTCCLPTPAAAAARFDLGPYVAGLQNTTLVAQGLSFNETHLFTSSVFNEYRMGYVRTNPFTTQSDYGHNSSTSLGIQGLNISEFATGLPNFTIGSACGNEFTCLQGGTAFLPAHPRQTDIQFEDTLSVTRGPHQLKVGFRYVRILASPYTNTFTRGGLTFGDGFTNVGTAGTGGAGLAAILLGFPNAGSRNFLQVPYYVTNVHYGAFIQDDWKVNPRLTLNIGVRYDIFTPDVEKNNKLANFNPATLSFIYAGVNGTSRSAGVQTRYGNVGPRFGLAYDVTGKGSTVVRAGFGITYFPDPFSASDELGQNPPFTVSQTFASPAAFPLAAAFAPANQCSASNLSTTCQPVLNNPFPQGANPLPLSALTTTAALNASAPAIVGHSLTNKTSNMQSYTFGIERQTLGGLVDVGYAGSHSVHLVYLYNPNEVGLLPAGNPTLTTVQRRLIQPLNNISTWAQEDPLNASNYNSLQASYTKRYTHGLTALVAYTFSKSLDYGGSPASGGGSAGNPQTVTNLRAGYGASGFDQKHRLVASVTYEFPFGKGKPFLNSGFVSHIVGGFEFDTITTYASGAPFTVTLNSGVNSGSPSWPDRIKSGKLDHGTPLRFFDTSAFVAPTVTAASGGRYGNSARSVLYGPSTKNWDMSVQRRIKLIENRSIAFKVDAFNAFNTPNFSTPNAAIGAGTAGQITGTNNENRDLQASATLYF